MAAGVILTGMVRAPGVRSIVVVQNPQNNTCTSLKIAIGLRHHRSGYHDRQ